MEWNERVKQNLQDAGCDERTMKAFRECSEQETGKNTCNPRQASLLTAHRKDLLDRLHQAQYRLDCLDYLLFQLRNA